MNFFNEDFRKFIEENQHIDPYQLRLSYSKSQFGFDTDFAILQIESRNKYKHKLSSFISNKKFIFPDSISGEQASHQAVALFHTILLDKKITLFDLTAGLGIDALSFAKKGYRVTAVELNSKKAEVLAKNAEYLSIENFHVVNSDSFEFLKREINGENNFFQIFIDPARRDNDNNRLFNLKDCSPDIFEILNLLSKTNFRILVKASPLLDITQTISDFKAYLKKIWVIGVKGECKELLLELSSENSKKDNYENDIILEAVNLNETGEIISTFICTQNEKRKSHINFIEGNSLSPGSFILEPSAMMMKIAPWAKICEIYKAKKLGNSSNIFISSDLPQNFPGRVTKFEKVITKKDRKSLSGSPITVISRNHPLSAIEIRKSINLKEGTEKFIYATRLGNKPIMLLSSSF